MVDHEYLVMPISISAAAIRPPRPFAMRSSACAAAGTTAILRRVNDGRPRFAAPDPLKRTISSKRWLDGVIAAIEASGLRGARHPLADDDMADHTDLAHWIGAPVDIDSTTSIAGADQGAARLRRQRF